MLRDEGHLLDVLDAMKHLVRTTSGMSFESFMADHDKQLIIERLFEIIGEASRRVSTAFREFHEDIPWHKMIGMRNRISHEYDKVDHAILWDIIHVEIPQMIRLIEPLVPPEE